MSEMTTTRLDIIATTDGGPAFPATRMEENPIKQIDHPTLAIPSHLEAKYPGMSLREWFAGQALAALADTDGAEPGVIAGWCVQLADAMLAACREKA